MRKLVACLGLVVVAAIAAILGFSRPSSAPARAAERAWGTSPIVAELDANVPATLLSGPVIAELAAAERAIGRLPGVQRVTGPGTYLQATVASAVHFLALTVGPGLWARAQRRAAAEARAQAAADASPATQAAAAEEERVTALGPTAAARYEAALVHLGLSTYPTLADQDFLDDVVLGTGVGPKPSVRWILPDDSHALIFVAPRAADGPAQIHRIAVASRQALAPLLNRISGLTVSLPGRPGPFTTVSFAVAGTDLARPAVVDWLSRADRRLAQAPKMSVAPNLGSLFGMTLPASASDVRAALRTLGPTLRGEAISGDRRVGEIFATVPTGAARAGARAIRAALGSPPPGVAIAPLGATSLAATTAIGSPARWLLITFCLGALALVVACAAGVGPGRPTLRRLRGGIRRPWRDRRRSQLAPTELAGAG